jgi:hypothetical protein
MEPHIKLLFVEASNAAVYEKERKVALALEAWFQNEDDSVIFVKSKHISQKTRNLLTPKEVGQGMKVLRQNEDQYSVEVTKRGYNSGTVWQVEA